MSHVAPLRALGFALILVSFAISGCGAPDSVGAGAQTATSCPFLKGVDLTGAHLSVGTFTPALRADGSSPVTDPAGHVVACTSPFANGTLLVGFSGHLDGRYRTLRRAEFERAKASGRKLGWDHIDAVLMPSNLPAGEGLTIKFNEGDQFGSILCVAAQLPLSDAEALTRALLLASSRTH